MDKLTQYKNRKQQLQTELDNINRQIIITEQSINTMNTTFQEQFGTHDATELETICNTYESNIVSLETELQQLEETTAQHVV
ncbi:MAG: hypothetical protein WC136_09310 [Sphaerochaeta sp.]|jgi:predicted  nucleic acid-binding Zn-ribbon protein